MEAGTSCLQAGVPQSPYHHRSSHQQGAAMTRFPKLPPVVFVTVQLPIFLIVPVSEGILAFRAPWRKERNKVPVGNKSQINGPFLTFGSSPPPGRFACYGSTKPFHFPVLFELKISTKPKVCKERRIQPLQRKRTFQSLKQIPHIKTHQ